MLERNRPWLTLAVVLALVFSLGACLGDESGVGVTALTGARLIVGDGSVVDEGVVLMREGRIMSVGAAGSIEVPDGATVIDASGKTIMPALVNAHFHLANDRAERIMQLEHLAYYGTSAAISLGLDEGTTGLAMRAETFPGAARSQSAGRGITSPEPGRSEVPYWVTTDLEARTAVRELADAQVDFVKIWVDSRNDQYERLSPDLYTAVIEEAHANGLRVAAHVFTLEDGKGLLAAGVDAFAHGIRDVDVDDEFVEMWLDRPEVVLIPNLPAPGVPVELTWMNGTVPPATLRAMETFQDDAPPGDPDFYAIQARNLARLHEEGVTIAFGTDGGNPWTVHQELEDMVRAGMPPADVIVAATKNSAELLRYEDLGTLEVGKSADLIVLNSDPLQDIRNSRDIDAVYLAGQALDRAALSARLLSGQ